MQRDCVYSCHIAIVKMQQFPIMTMNAFHCLLNIHL